MNSGSACCRSASAACHCCRCSGVPRFGSSTTCLTGFFFSFHRSDLGVRLGHQFRASGDHPFFRFPCPVGPILLQILEAVVALGLFGFFKLGSLLSKLRLLLPESLLLLFESSTLLFSPFVPGLLFLLRGRFRPSVILLLAITVCSTWNIIFCRELLSAGSLSWPNSGLGAPSKASSLEAGPCGPLDMETTSLIFSC